MTTNKLMGLGLALLLVTGNTSAQSFTDVTDAAGLGTTYTPLPTSFPAQMMTCSASVGDYDNDGWDDIFYIGGHGQPAALFHNDGNGSFTNLAASAGLDVQLPGAQSLWVDADDDGDIDLYIVTYEKVSSATALGPNGAMAPPVPGGLGSVPNPGLASHRNWYFENNGDGTFTDKSISSGLYKGGRWGAAAGDIDGDGDLDIVTVSWSAHGGIDGLTHAEVLVSQGDGTFRHRTPAIIASTLSAGFSPHIVDMDGDGDNEIFWAGDFSSSKYYRNEGGMQFTDATVEVGYGTDENGMGSCVFDYDNDNDLDIFVSSVWAAQPLPQPAWGHSGNRMYSNDGSGSFTDTTDASGVRNGMWGWAADYGDLDNDGDFDLIHTNGFYSPPEQAEFLTDRVRVFVNDGTGVFTDEAANVGVDDPDQGRGLVVFDFNWDGALDFLVSNHDTGLTLYQGDRAASPGNWLEVRLKGTTSNSQGIGARVWVDSKLSRQLDKIEAGSNFMSQSPPSARFGLGDNPDPVAVRVLWPSGILQKLDGIAVDQAVTIVEP